MARRLVVIGGDAEDVKRRRSGETVDVPDEIEIVAFERSSQCGLWPPVARRTSEVSSRIASSSRRSSTESTASTLESTTRPLPSTARRGP